MSQPVEDDEAERDARVMFRHREVSVLCAVAGHFRQKLPSGEVMPCPWPNCPDNRGIGNVLYVAETPALRHMLRADDAAIGEPVFIKRDRYIVRHHMPTGTRAWVLDWASGSS